MSNYDEAVKYVKFNLMHEHEAKMVETFALWLDRAVDEPTVLPGVLCECDAVYIGVGYTEVIEVGTGQIHRRSPLICDDD